MSDQISATGAEAIDLTSLFETARPTFEAFTSNVEQLLKMLLKLDKIEYLGIETRTKSIESFRNKLQRPTKRGKYTQIHDVTDLAGLRIVAYYQKDVRAICRLIEENFTVDVENTSDKNDAIAPDRFGYLSVHYIISLNKDRESLSEYKAFKGLKAEIQIRTVLQHAWAVLDRKLRYNQEEDIPKEIRRKLFRVSALLEVADENFSEIDQLVTNLRSRYERGVRTGELDQDINLDSIEVFMRESDAVNALALHAAVYLRVRAH